VIGLTLLIPVPYFVMQPGEAIDVKPLVQVGTNKPVERGMFFLTTVSLKEGTVFDYLYSKVSKQVELIPSTRILSKNESKEEYERRQAEYMIESQNDAIIAAYKQAKKPVDVKVTGIEVFDVVKNISNGLQPGDLIKKIDHQPIESAEQLIQYLSTKKAGDTVAVHVIRGKKELDKNIKLVTLPKSNPGEKERAGLGIIPITRVVVKTDPPARIHTEQIGGPSAGLMFSLEVLNRLLPEDLTHGYRVAGTGTISETGNIGQIGGIQHKIVAADRQNAQFFFCPRDSQPGDQNEKVAMETAKRMGTKMKVVPVSTLDEAVRYLKSLPEQNTSHSFKSKALTRVA
jgi:PDZ domain-containing protein